MEKEVTIRISCDKYRTADFLRQLANEIEARDEDDEIVFETEYGYAEVIQ